MEVIGAGNGRTGTKTLKTALEILGYDPCYHMVEVMQNNHAKFWIKVADGEEYSFEEVFGPKKYKASCDFPSAIYWREQLERYPNAKVILTARDPESWYKSCSDTIFRVMPNGPHSSFGVRMAMWVMGAHHEMLSKVIVRDYFHNDMSKENVLKCYNDHNAKVIAECPKDKLLVFEVAQGWEPLCKFLDKPIPSVPFPRVNDTAEFQRIVFMLEAVGYAITVALFLPLVGLVWFATKQGHIEL